MYVYVYLDPRINGKWKYQNHVFNNKPLYVGVGSKSRYLAHWRNTKGDNKEYINPILKNKLKAIISVGSEPIMLKIYNKISREEAFEHEIAIIKLLGKIKDGTGILTNIGDGGEHQRIGTIKSQCKPVVMFDLSGNRMEDFESVVAAQFKMTGALKGKGMITKNLKNKSITAYGHIFKYKSDIGDIKKLDISYLNNFGSSIGTFMKQVHCYNSDGTFNKSFDSRIKTSDIFKVSPSNILYHINNNSVINGFILSDKKCEKLCT